MGSAGAGTGCGRGRGPIGMAKSKRPDIQAGLEKKH